jgi:hypothetical protein
LIDTSYESRRAILNHKLKQKKPLEFQPKIKQQFKAKINWQTIQKKKQKSSYFESYLILSLIMLSFNYWDENELN